MPWEIRKDGPRWCVHKQDTGELVKCHPTREQAERHLKALYVNVEGRERKLYGILPEEDR